LDCGSSDWSAKLLLQQALTMVGRSVEGSVVKRSCRTLCGFWPIERFVGLSAATLVLALSSWFGLSQPATAGSLADLFTKQDDALPAEASAYASAGQPRYDRQHRLWRHARHHRRYQREEPEVDAHASAAQPMPAPPLPQLPPASEFQVVLITADGGDPFERYMTAYYWSRLNHAVLGNQLFEPARRYVAGATLNEVLHAQHAAESWVSKSVSR
jgi:hypothetical protein